LLVFGFSQVPTRWRFVFFRGRDEKGLCVRRAPVSAQCGALESPRRAPARRGVTGHTPEPAWAFARGTRARIRRTPASTDRTASAFGSALGGKRGIAESTNARSPSGWFGKNFFGVTFFTRFSRTRGRNLLLTLARFLPSSSDLSRSAAPPTTTSCACATCADCSTRATSRRTSSTARASCS
jgi:hypothetical protein